jgi:hypothetical protein
MNTKYNTGQAVLIPATISTVEQINGKIVYHVEADTWNGIPEDAIVVDEKAEAQMAMKTFIDSLFGENGI